MSRIWAVVVIAIIILGLCFIESYKLNSTFDYAEEMVIMMQDKYKTADKKEIETDAKKLKRYWESNEKMLSFFLPDAELDGARLEISSLPLLYNDDKFLYYCNSILFKIKHLKERISHSIL